MRFTHTCRQCNYLWISYKQNPERCAHGKCRSLCWDRERHWNNGPRKQKLIPLIDRFNKLYLKDLKTGCWIWQGTKSRKGYGIIWDSERKHRKHAHRASYSLFNGTIPDGLCVLHKCDIPACVNPEHLFLGTNADNNEDCRKKGRNAFGETNGSAKLTNEQVRKIRSDTRTSRKIAKDYNVSNMTVSYIKRRIKWKHLT